MVHEGRLDLALSEFEAAYQAEPQFSVLYNIALAQSALGRPQDALLSFERYLAEGGKQIDDTRRTEVGKLIAAARARLGEIVIKVQDPEAASVWLDGTRLEPTQLNHSIAVRPGPHEVRRLPREAMSEAKRFEVHPAERIELQLTPRPAERTLPAQLLVMCDVPDVDVRASDGTSAKTPLTFPLMVVAGNLSVAFSRPGYRTTTHQLSVASGANYRLDCALLPNRPLPPTLASRLEIHTTPQDAAIQLDGQPLSGRTLPSGDHLISVERPGYATWRRRITLQPAKTLRLDVFLRPLVAAPENKQVGASQRSWGYGLSGLGTVAIVTGTVLSLWNGARYRDWLHSSTRHTSTAVSLQRVDDLALGSFVIGGMSLAAGGWLLLGAQHD